MTGIRVLLTGMGGELGTRVTNLLEATPGIDEIIGLDVDPPRRRIPQAHFHRVEPGDRRRIVDVVREAEPTHFVHLGVFEPHARRPPRAARRGTERLALHALGAAALVGSVRRIVVRSGIEVYGRGRGSATRPDEGVPPAPTSGWGSALLGVERTACQAGEAAGAPVTLLRMGPVVGPHVPSPLGRFLRLPAVPVSAVSDLPFSLLHQEDAAAAVVAATTRPSAVDGPVNVVGSGAVTTVQAVRLGGRVPVPTLGPGWALAAAFAELWGAPLPDHVRELLVRGRVADGSSALSMLGVAPARSTPEVLKELYDWAEVVHLDVTHRRVA